MGIFLGPAIIACLLLSICGMGCLYACAAIAMHGPWRLRHPTPPRAWKLLTAGSLLGLMGLAGQLLIVYVEQQGK